VDVEEAQRGDGARVPLPRRGGQDLTVSGGEVRFADPLQKNLRAGLGRALGQMAIASDLSKQMELSIPVHGRICELLAVTARAVA
jgi:hypothetical protein